MNIQTIKNNQKIIGDFLSEMSSEVADGVEKASALWLDIFGSRINFPTLDEYMVFRRNGATYGVGDPSYSNNNLIIQHCKKNALLLKEDGVTDDFLEKVMESPLGAPHLSNKHVLNFEASPNFLKNLRNAFRIYKLIGHEFEGKEIRICEIGAGYGMLATMLHQLFNVKSYTVIDLPQNLYLTSMYLTSLLPNKSFQFIHKKNKGNGDLKELNFVLARDVNLIDSEFDLVINIDSFGEMNSETAFDYVQWARKRLAPDGILHTDNRVRVRTCSGPMDFTDLGYLVGYEILHVDGTRVQAELLSQPHHICFLRRNENKVYDSKQWDLVSILYTLGLANSVQADVSTNWAMVDKKIISTSLELLRSDNSTVINNLAQSLEKVYQLPPYVSYILFLVRFAQGHSVKRIAALDAYLAANMKEPADAIARIVRILELKANSHQIDHVQFLRNEFILIYPHLAEDLDEALITPSVALRSLRIFAAETITAKQLNSNLMARVQRRLTRNYFSK